MTAEIAFYRYIVNPGMRLLLRSPLHGIISHNVGILHFTGRSSGRALSTPLSYTREGDTVRLLSSQNTVWWRNFRGGPAPVELDLEQQRYSGSATLYEGDSDALRDRVRRFLHALPRDARVYGVELDKNKQVVEESLAEVAPGLILVEISLD